MATRNSRLIDSRLLRAASLLRGVSPQAGSCQVGAGFDAFVDTIQRVVASRSSPRQWTALSTIHGFAERVTAAAGKSAGIELVPQGRQAGGNAILFAKAVALLGWKTTCIAPVGFPSPHPVFAQLPFHSVSIGEPGTTEAVEFDDGKLLLSCLGDTLDVNWERLEAQIGRQEFLELVLGMRLFLLGDWSNLPGMDGIVAELARLKTSDPLPIFFVDLADPTKRGEEQLRSFLAELGLLSRRTTVVLGLNRNEAERVLAALGCQSVPREDPDSLQSCCREIQARSSLQGVVIHALRCAAATLEGDDASGYGPFCASPVLSTGAGDHFNGAFAAGLVSGMNLEVCLDWGMAGSGFLVRHGHSASREELSEFLEQWASDFSETGSDQRF